MGLGDIVNKAKDLAADHPDQVDQGIDKAGDAVDQRTGDKHVTQVDKAPGGRQGPPRRHQQPPA